MNQKLKKWLNKFETFKNSNFIKKHVLNSVLFGMIGFVLLVLGLLLIIIGFVKANNLNFYFSYLLGFGFFFLSLSFCLYMISFFLVFLLKKNEKFIQKMFNKKINWIPFFFWKGFIYTDKITQLEIHYNYDFEIKKKDNEQTLNKSIKSGSVNLKNVTSESINVAEITENQTTKKLTCQTQKKSNEIFTNVFFNEKSTNNKIQDSSEIKFENQKIENLKQVKADLQEKMEQYQLLLKQKQDMSSKLLNLQKNQNNNNNNLFQNKEISIKNIESQINQQTIKIEEKNEQMTLLINKLDLSTRTKMIQKKEELEKIYNFYQKIKKEKK